MIVIDEDFLSIFGNLLATKNAFEEFPDGSEAKIWHCCCCGPARFDPWPWDFHMLWAQ